MAYSCPLPLAFALSLLFFYATITKPLMIETRHTSHSLVQQLNTASCISYPLPIRNKNGA